MSGEVATPENGLPMKTIVSAPSARPALPSSACRPVTVAAIARTVRLSAALLAKKSPPMTSSQLWTISVAASPVSTLPVTTSAGPPPEAAAEQRGERRR